MSRLSLLLLLLLLCCCHLLSCLQENVDDVAMLRRVEEITDKLLREAYPDAYVPAPTKKKVS